MSMTLQSSYTLVPGTFLLGTVDAAYGLLIVGAKNANASASIPIGSPVAYKPSGATSDIDATTPANASDKIMGITIRSDSQGRAWTDENGTHGELDSVGVLVGVIVPVLRRGRVFVTCTTGCLPSQPLFVSVQVAGAYTAAGQMGNVTATNAIDLTAKGEWRTTAAALGGAWLDVNFV